jgi:phage FluMu protein Com
MTTSEDQKLDFKPIRCNKCGATLFYITPTEAPFSIKIKCKRCTLKYRAKMKRRRVTVYVVVQISLESAQEPGIDSNPENPVRT